MLNLDQIHIFLSVARNLHFSRAAEELYISQPAVSATIAKLESQTGISLFHRIGRRVELTDAGRYLQREGHMLLEQSQRLEQGLHDFNALQRGSLQLGASFTVGNYWLPQHLTRFKAIHPGIELHCHLANADSILAGTDGGQFDLGFLCGRPPEGSVSAVGEERLILVVGRAHPWFGCARIQPKHLQLAEWLIREPGSGARQMLEQNLQEIGLDPVNLNIHQVLHSSEMMKAMVSGGVGLAALPASMVEQDIKHGALWQLNLEGHFLRSEPIWMVRSPQRQNSILRNRFEALILEGSEQSSS